MRTTVTIADHLLEALERQATEEGTTVSRLIEHALRLAAAQRLSAPSEEFELVTFGGGESFTRLDVDKTASLEREDLDGPEAAEH